MKKMLLIALALTSGAAIAQVQRDGYITKNGTYVAPSVATKPNDTKLDNYSTKGNINPATGKAGTVEPYKIEPYKVEPLRLKTY